MRFELNKQIIDEYQNNQSLNQLAKKYGTTASILRRRLVKAGVPIRRHTIVESVKKPMEYNPTKFYKKMVKELRYEITLDWLSQFDNLEKLKLLNRCVAYLNFSTNQYVEFVENFYTDKQFNTLYDKYVATGNKWFMPSLDHIVPKSKGGTNELSNLRFISFLENMSKKDLDLSDWEKIKLNFNYYFMIEKDEKSSSFIEKDKILIPDQIPRKVLVGYLNMQAHIRFDVDLEWFLKFRDFEKLKYLNRLIINRDKNRFNETSEWYKSYIEKFYYDSNFNLLYERFKKTGDKYVMPSLDHIIPRSKGGTNELENLKFITYIENFCKRNIEEQEWKEIKTNIQEYYDFEDIGFRNMEVG